MTEPRPFADVPNQLYIGGKWCDASDTSTFDVLDPATGEVLATVASGSEEDARRAVDAADEAGRDWAATPPRARAEILRRAFELMTSRIDEFTELIVRENGKSWADAAGEVKYAAEFFRWYSEEAVRVAGHLQTSPQGDKRILTLQQPIGTAVLVTPWNFPAAMATRKIAPALAAGCPVVLKPASDTPLTALAVAQVLTDAGVPAGVVNVLPARRSGAVVKAMLAHPATRKLSFTGSTEVGRALLRDAAEQILSVSMELGGNAPFLVFDDADLETAVAGAVVAKMRNGGQSCIAANRFYVQSGIYDEFADRLTKALSELSLGSGLDRSVEVGAMINAAAVEETTGLVAQSVEAGATVTTGGEAAAGPGAFYPPTVITGIDGDNPILEHEIFGPVAPLVRFDTEAQALDLANATQLGLASYVFTADLARALRVSEALEAGMVGVNRGFISDPTAPFGGVKHSGLGREGGSEGIHEFMETKYVAIDW
ncbi:NAD-dependent succinate-semialdehyde dehydrogenase [Rhodococcus sp. NCIMB 12038]|uniref:NAD-dependent succinate-semialdehyde dehydrogenase n=1 Tax=Rhodococcus sp. NCIMB 12038 TaxID=933800 RepID=UPI000B3C72DB|nr:NAD-dependent succinate-semialdehyde dehydrogenase [Rhodococcus sp. NCIMB 12038]OUS93310.1 NAD-dependent succinate-semialdehyde dehydrogenase [Rhodococcus sp. NCIMB 12038]